MYCVDIQLPDLNGNTKKKAEYENMRLLRAVIGVASTTPRILENWSEYIRAFVAYISISGLSMTVVHIMPV